MALTRITDIGAQVIHEIQNIFDEIEPLLPSGPTGGLDDPGADGIVVRYNVGVTGAVELTQPAAGLTITPANGVSGSAPANPVFALANDLAALEGLSGTGFAKRTGTDTWSVGALSSGDIPDLSGTYQPLDADLSAIAALSGTGFAVRTAANTWAQRTITGTSLQIAVSNGDGVSGNPTLSIPSNAQLSIDTLAAASEITTAGFQAANAIVNTLAFNGSTSGQVTIQPAAIAGTWTLTLPTNDGDSGQALVTNGAGITSWETVLTANQTITLSGDVTGSGSTAITTSIAAQNSSFWRGKVTDETGTGLWVFNDSPTLITPVLGVASGTSLVLSGTLTADNVVAPAEVRSAAHVTTGLTSGAVTIQSQTGTWTLTLPTDDGTSGQVLTTDGAGVTSWTTISGGGGANTALSNLASVAINTSLVLGTSDGGALGSTTKMWSDLFLASGAVINFNNGDALITHSADLLTISGAQLVTENIIAASLSTSGGGDLVVEGSATIGTVLMPDANDGAVIGSTTRQWSDLFLASGAVINFANGDLTLTHSSNLLTIAGGAVTLDDLTVNNSSTFDGDMTVNASLTTAALTVGAGGLSPDTNDGASIGSATTQFSDLFLAEGGVINWDNGDATLTQTGNVLTLAGADLALGANNLTMTGSLAATGARVTKGWFTDLECTNAITGSVTGSAATLTTARTINGISFNGSANINVPAGIFVTGFATGLAAAADLFFAPGTTLGGSGTLVQRQVAASAGLLQNLRVHTGATQSGTGSLVVKVWVNGSASALTATVTAGGAAGTYDSGATTVSISAGDLLSVEVINNASATSTANVLISFYLM